MSNQESFISSADNFLVSLISQQPRRVSVMVSTDALGSNDLHDVNISHLLGVKAQRERGKGCGRATNKEKKKREQRLNFEEEVEG